MAKHRDGSCRLPYQSRVVACRLVVRLACAGRRLDEIALARYSQHLVHCNGIQLQAAMGQAMCYTCRATGQVARCCTCPPVAPCLVPVSQIPWDSLRNEHDMQKHNCDTATTFNMTANYFCEAAPVPVHQVIAL